MILSVNALALLIVVTRRLVNAPASLSDRLLLQLWQQHGVPTTDAFVVNPVVVAHAGTDLLLRLGVVAGRRGCEVAVGRVDSVLLISKDVVNRTL